MASFNRITDIPVWSIRYYYSFLLSQLVISFNVWRFRWFSQTLIVCFTFYSLLCIQYSQIPIIIAGLDLPLNFQWFVALPNVYASKSYPLFYCFYNFCFNMMFCFHFVSHFSPFNVCASSDFFPFRSINAPNSDLFCNCNVFRFVSLFSSAILQPNISLWYRKYSISLLLVRLIVSITVIDRFHLQRFVPFRFSRPIISSSLTCWVVFMIFNFFSC